MRQLCLAVLLVGFLPLLAADKGDDEIATIRTLWTIAEKGKASGAKEADLVPLLTKDFKGRRLAPWCYHALVQIGVPREKHYDLFLSVSRSWEAKPEGTSDAEHAKAKAGPPLPEDLKPAYQTVWTKAVEIICERFASADEGHVDNYRGNLGNIDAPKDILIPRVCAILADPKRTISQRNVSAMILGYLGPDDTIIDPLLKALNDPAAKVRYNAINALRSQGTRSGASTFTLSNAEQARTAITNLLKTETDKMVLNAGNRFLKDLK